MKNLTLNEQQEIYGGGFEGDCNLNCVSKEKNIIFTNTVFL